MGADWTLRGTILTLEAPRIAALTADFYGVPRNGVTTETGPFLRQSLKAEMVLFRNRRGQPPHSARVCHFFLPDSVRGSHRRPYSTRRTTPTTTPNTRASRTKIGFIDELAGSKRMRFRSGNQRLSVASPSSVTAATICPLRAVR
jgi:hypothetical protein